MPRYIIERTVGSMTEEELAVAAKRSIKVVDSMEGVVWIKSYMSAAEGKMYCEYEAPSPDAIMEHARRAGLPVDKISEVSVENQPSDVSLGPSRPHFGAPCGISVNSQ